MNGKEVQRTEAFGFIMPDGLLAPFASADPNGLVAIVGLLAEKIPDREIQEDLDREGWRTVRVTITVSE